MIFLFRLIQRWRAGRASEAAEAGQTVRSRRAGAHPRSPLALVAHQARYDTVAFLRNGQARFFTMILPILFLVIFVSVFGNNTVGPQHVKASTYYVPGLSALAIVAASFVNLVISITAQRELGVLKRRRATPVPAWVLIAGRTITAVVVSLVVMTVLLLIGRFAYGVHLPTSTLPGVAITAIVGSITFCILAYAFSTVVKSEDAAQPMVQAIMLPLYFISGVFIPNVSLPEWLRRVAEVFPVQHLSDGLHHAYDPAARGIGIVWSDLGVLALWAAFGLAIALWRFSWTPAAVNA
jgi:ABC-2 type transport system permease protein